MKIQSSLTRIRTQLSALERMMRTLRAEVESQISAYAPADVDTVSEVETGLGQMFATGKPLAPFTAQPYQHFAPGVWLGFDQEVGDCDATVALKSLRTHDPANQADHVSRLSINPVFPLVEKPRWVTLECAMDIASLRQAKGLRVDLITFFDISSRNTAPIPRHVALSLRLRYADGTTADHLNYRVPVSTMPFEHSMVLKGTSMDGIDLAHATEAQLLIELPLAGEFTFHMDYFSLKTIGA